MLPLTCACGAEAIVVRMGPHEFRVECTMCSRNNVGPCRSRARAVFEWNSRRLQGQSVTGMICGELFGAASLDELTDGQLGELLKKLRRIPEGRTKDRRDKL